MSGKGSGRRPGRIPPGNWEMAFGRGKQQPESCPRCGGSGHVPEDCKWPVIEEGKKE